MPEFNNLRNRVAVVGVGTTAYGSFPETDEYGLAAEAFRNALGLRPRQKQDRWAAHLPDPKLQPRRENLGLDPRWTMTLPGHGRMSGIRPIEATIALAAGQANMSLFMPYRPIAARFYGGDESPGYRHPGDLRLPARHMR